MRRRADQELIGRFMRSLGDRAGGPVRVYFTGGVSAVLMGWRESTIDIDLCSVPERDEIFRALPRLKEELEVNVELASPADFVPVAPGWEARSRFIASEGRVQFLHYDFYSQVLAKIERGHEQDRSDVRAMISEGLVQPEELRRQFEVVTPELYRYPAVDAEAFRLAVERVAAEA